MSRHLKWWPYILIALALLASQAVALLIMGHPLVCTCGSIKFWQGVVASAENSQQITDWYTFSHIIHGILFYLLLWGLFPKMPVGLRFILALGIEASWEVIENTPMVINHYRAQALSRGYTGDSIINSVSDSLAMIIGFILARTCRVWLIIALVIGLELFTLYMIRDGLALNVIQIIHPFPFIWHWQAGA